MMWPPLVRPEIEQIQLALHRGSETHAQLEEMNFTGRIFARLRIKDGPGKSCCQTVKPNIFGSAPLT